MSCVYKKARPPDQTLARPAGGQAPMPQFADFSLPLRGEISQRVGGARGRLLVAIELARPARGWSRTARRRPADRAAAATPPAPRRAWGPRARTCRSPSPARPAAWRRPWARSP